MPDALKIDTRRGRLGALRWSRPGKPRVLALHGWLDNAASFLPLAEHLSDVDLVAIDWPGHGHSDHRPDGAHYYFMEYLWDLAAVLDALKWPRAHLLGHSLGGAVGCCFAAAMPERVVRLALLDAPGPLSGAPDDAAERLRRAMHWQRRPRRALKQFPDIEAAVSARLEATPMDRDAARLLCERALRAVDGGFEWRSDPRLGWVSPTVLMEPQVRAIIGGIEAEVRLLLARPLQPFMDERGIDDRLAAFRHLETIDVDGHHHFHMEQPDATASALIDFLSAPTDTSPTDGT